jgi:catalase
VIDLFSRGGAFGVFEATDDLSDVCKAKVFKRGTKTRVLMRFSTVGTSLKAKYR